MKNILFVFLLSMNVFAETSSCEDATISYEASLEVYVLGETVNRLGWEAYNLCKEDLAEEHRVIVEEYKNKCLTSAELSDEQKVDCAFRTVEFFLYSEALYE